MWRATLRPDGSPHLKPAWFRFDDNLWSIGTAQRNTKVKNLSRDNRVSLALFADDDPVVAESRAAILRGDLPESVVTGFSNEYHNRDVRLPEPVGPRALILVPVDRSRAALPPSPASKASRPHT